MLQFLELFNFQKHINYKIEFSPSITTIVGPTGSGKSSILRALEFVAVNRQPRKGTWQRNKNADCKATLGLDGQIITRVKGKTNNTYYLGQNEYKAFGTGVPEPIAKLLNVSPLNFARQLDNPFWFLDTAGQVSRNLNSIINLEIIDTTLANAASNVKSTKSRLLESERRLNELKQKKDDLKWVVKVDKDLQALELLDKSIQETTQKRFKLADILTKAQRHVITKRNATQAILDAQKAIQLGQTLLDISTKQKRLASFIKEYERLSSIKSPPDIKYLEGQATLLKTISNKKDKLTSLVGKIEFLERNLCQLQSSLTEAKSKIPTTCPLCQSPLPAQ